MMQRIFKDYCNNQRLHKQKVCVQNKEHDLSEPWGTASLEGSQINVQTRPDEDKGSRVDLMGSRVAARSTRDDLHRVTQVIEGSQEFKEHCDQYTVVAKEYLLNTKAPVSAL